MINNIYKLIGLFGIVLFSGCSSTAIVYSIEPKVAGEGYEIVVSTANNSDSNILGAVHVKHNNNSKFLIQANAELTMGRGFKYFRIVDPLDTSAEMLSSADELKARCYDNHVGSSFFGADWCYVTVEGGYTNKIVYYKERPSDYLVFDAKEIVEYMRDNEELVDIKEIRTFESRSLDDSYAKKRG